MNASFGTRHSSFQRVPEIFHWREVMVRKMHYIVIFKEKECGMIVRHTTSWKTLWSVMPSRCFYFVIFSLICSKCSYYRFSFSFSFPSYKVIRESESFEAPSGHKTITRFLDTNNDRKHAWNWEHSNNLPLKSSV